ncbi:hypothetical protein QR685DRAFT_232720 [Neurospora intermedia]|uniref:Uncharacterized protein n=1 Tax=Neurospora intermedia TaxID=5142 RepID=A0ABR3DIZ4_NEUIN
MIQQRYTLGCIRQVQISNNLPPKQCGPLEELPGESSQGMSAPAKDTHSRRVELALSL